MEKPSVNENRSQPTCQRSKIKKWHKLTCRNKCGNIDRLKGQRHKPKPDKELLKCMI